MSDQKEVNTSKALISKVIIPNLTLSSIFIPFSQEDEIVKLVDPSTKEKIVYSRKPDLDFGQESYNHFPVVLSADGSPWRDATLYLLDKLETIKKPKSTTLNCIADDLSVFGRYLDDNEVDYLTFPKRKMARPTYRYRAYIQRKLDNGDIAASTAKRQIGNVIGFYRWLDSQHDTDFEYPLWRDKEVYIAYTDQKGLRQSTAVKSTDIAVKTPKNREDYSEYIDDGGKLRPLPKEEQEILIKALMNIGNIEMTLSFLIALTTGARIQTVFTLRLKDIQLNVGEKNHVPIIIGLGTDVDSKYQKRMVIYLPLWLQERLQNYSISERALRRREKSKHKFDSDEDQYLFLTLMGSPYYIAENDPLLSTYRYPSEGVAIRTFIYKFLKPELIKLGFIADFTFHFLRATFALNLLEEKVAQVEKGKDKLFDVLMLVKERMGHRSIATTEAYLNYRKKFKLAVNIQSEFECYLRDITDAEPCHE